MDSGILKEGNSTSNESFIDYLRSIGLLTIIKLHYIFHSAQIYDRND